MLEILTLIGTTLGPYLAEFLLYALSATLGGIISSALTEAIGSSSVTISDVENVVRREIDAKITPVLSSIASTTGGISKQVSNVSSLVVSQSEEIEKSILSSIEEVNSDVVGNINLTRNRILDAVNSVNNDISNEIYITQRNITSSLANAEKNISQSIASTQNKIVSSINSVESSVAQNISLAEEKITNTISKEIADAEAVIYVSNLQTQTTVRESISQLDSTLQSLPESITQTISDTSSKTQESINALTNEVKNITSAPDSDIVETFASTMSPAISAIPELDSVIAKVANMPAWTKWLLAIPCISDILKEYKEVIFGPELTKLKQLSSSISREALLEIPSLLTAYLRGFTSIDYVKDVLSRYGHSDENIDILLALTRQVIDVSTLADCAKRGIISYDKAKELAKQQGIAEEDFDVLTKSVERFIDLSTAIDIALRFDLPDEFLTEIAIRQSINPDLIPLLKEYQKQVINPNDIKNLFLRGVISEQEHDLLMKRAGYPDYAISLLKELYYYIPSPPDLVSMAVREAWNDEVAEHFGYDEDFPEEFAVWAEKQGMSREWSKRYWRAHWQLPSAYMAYEMFHRGIITKEELETLLKIADYPKFWREKLMQLSYATLTRVDVRRMYETGILKSDEVFKAYKDLGYDDWAAEKLTQFAIIGASEEERDLTRTDILDAYKDAILSKEEAISALREMGYNDEESELLIARVDYDEYKKYINDEVKNIEEDYESQYIDENEAIRRLSALNIDSATIERYLRRWKPKRNAKTTKLTLTQLQALVKAKVIDLQTFAEELSGLGYKDKYVEWLVTLAMKNIPIPS